MAKEILFNEAAREKIRVGIDKVCDAVKMTLGPRGRAVVLDRGNGIPQVTFDGVTVAKEIELEDNWENVGANLIKQAADKTNSGAGDGTTTSTVLAQAIIAEGEKVIGAGGTNVIRLAEELSKSGDTVISLLEKQAQKIDGLEKISEVATIASKDPEIGKLIATVMDKVGIDGVVVVDDSDTIYNKFEVVEGMRVDRGFINHYFVTNPDTNECVLESPYILVTDKKINGTPEILKLMEAIVASGKRQVLVIADDVEGEALTTLVLNKLKGTLNICAIKAPDFGDRKKEILKDIATLTGASFISSDLGSQLESADLQSLGGADRVVITKDYTTIIGGKGSKIDITSRIENIKKQIADNANKFEKEKLQQRLGRLSGGIAVIKIGAPTESAQKELKQRVEDAVFATQAAMEDGIVPGGGKALFNVSMEITGGDAERILMSALRVPMKSIVENTGINADTVLSFKYTDPWYGFNASTGQMENLKVSGIIDPLKVTKTAFQNALSVAINYLMIGAAVINIPEKKDVNIS